MQWMSEAGWLMRCHRRLLMMAQRLLRLHQDRKISGFPADISRLPVPGSLPGTGHVKPKNQKRMGCPSRFNQMLFAVLGPGLQPGEYFQKSSD